MDIETIEKRCEALEAKRTTVRERMQAMREEIGAVRKRHMPGIRKAVIAAREARGALYLDVEVSPELFTRPKTRTLHNIRVGWKKQRGRVRFPSMRRSIDLARQKLPKKAGDLIRTKEELDKQAAAKLPVADIQRIGGEVSHDTDVPIVEPTGDDIDRAVDGLIQTDSDIEDAA